MTLAHSAMPPRRGPFKVLVAGGSYAGVAAIVTLLDLCSGKEKAAPSVDDAPPSSPSLESVEITLVDERDGYCEPYIVFPPASFPFPHTRHSGLELPLTHRQTT